MRADYREWLERQKYDAGTISAQLHRSGRVEKHYGDLDENYAKDRLTSLISNLRYTSDDRRRGKPNPTKIPFDGDPYNNIASYRNSINLYQRFRDSLMDPGQSALEAPLLAGPLEDEAPPQRFGLERDMQAALRKSIGRLESGLEIIDDGVERVVDSGRIDITARDTKGRLVVIELKAGIANASAVAQLLGYMGDVSAEESDENVRGILVASDFDKRTTAAARVVPNLSLHRYSIDFAFCEVVPRSADKN
jgi:hypothetical protein